MHMHRFQLIAAIVIGLIVAVLIVVIPLANNDNTDLPRDDNNEVIELPMGELIVRARDVLVKKGVSENEITSKLTDDETATLKKILFKLTI